MVARHGSGTLESLSVSGSCHGVGCLGSHGKHGIRVCLVGSFKIRDRSYRTRGGRYQLGESGNGSIHSDSPTHPRSERNEVGEGGKTSLGNTADDDILEYILSKLTVRITVTSRTFLVKVKAHRGEPLNEGTDDLVEVGHPMEREGINYRWTE